MIRTTTEFFCCFLKGYRWIFLFKTKNINLIWELSWVTTYLRLAHRTYATTEPDNKAQAFSSTSFHIKIPIIIIMNDMYNILCPDRQAVGIRVGNKKNDWLGDFCLMRIWCSLEMSRRGFWMMVMLMLWGS